MSPRKERYQTPPHIAQAIRDKRKKMMHGSYYCPQCGLEKLCIAIDKNRKEVVASCACGLEHQLIYVSAFEAVDYYNKFADQFKKSKRLDKVG
jgi:transcription elongation factor Elf1